MSKPIIQQRQPPRPDTPNFEQPPDATGDEVLNGALARIGRLEMVLAAIGGAVHDVNNLLTVLSGHLYLLTEAVREQPALLARARDARNTAERASTLIRELLSFARGKDDAVTVICPARHAKAIEPLLRRAVAAKHKLEILHSTDPWLVACSGAQLESAIANLIINANHAMTREGSIMLGVANVKLNAGEARRAGLQAGQYVCLQVTDTGCGIPADKLSRVTEPLYTSKPAGAGSGMGLPMVQRFAGKAGGAMQIDSIEGKGTTVRVWLPRSERQLDASASMTLPLSTLPAGSETVLLVTRDSDVRTTIQQLLDALGYTVIASDDRNLALQIANDHREIALVICDRTEGGIHPDRQWLSSLQQVLPEVRQLAVLSPDTRADVAAPDASAHLWKPVGIAELARTMRVALEKPE